MKANRTTYERYVYWLAFLVALALRLFQLGAAPLADSEANWALQALGLAHGQFVTLGAQPGYILLTSLLFSLIKDTNFLARFIPALAGSLLVWLPFYFRRWMGNASWLKRAGFVLAFGLAIDPGLVSLSRQAGSLIPALVFTLLALAAFYNSRMVWLGIFAGLALLSGPAFLQGLLILAITWGLWRLFGRHIITSEPQASEDEVAVEPAPERPIRKAVPSFLLTLILAGTLFLRVSEGFGALADTLTAYLHTWTTSSGVPAARLPASLLVYQLIVIILAIVAFIRPWAGKAHEWNLRPVVLGLGMWALVAILLPLLYAGRQVGDMAWSLIPLWALAAIEIGHTLHLWEDKTTNSAAVCLAALLFLLAVTGWMNVLSIGRDPGRAVIYAGIILGAFVLGLIGVLLVAAGWSINSASLGVVLALCLAFGLQFISNTVVMTVVHQNGAQELWSPSTTTGQADLLLSTLADFSSWNTGLRDQLDIVVLNSPPSLQWALRRFPNASFVTALPASASPPVVITVKGTEEPSLAEKYRGEDFVWSLSPGWQGAFPPDFINWLTFRAAPLAQSQVILWARADIFPGGAPVTGGASNTPASNTP
jgi:hypothetical protein